MMEEKQEALLFESVREMSSSPVLPDPPADGAFTVEP